MNSINRISNPSDRPISTSRMISVSEKFRMATALILMDLNPTSAATLIPSNTSLRQSFRLTWWNFSGSSASRLMLSLCNPASFRVSACSLRKNALVVMAMSSMPSTLASIRMRTDRSFRMSGSPPVSLSRQIPIPDATWAMRVISSKVSSLSRRMNSTLSAGMQ